MKINIIFAIIFYTFGCSYTAQADSVKFSGEKFVYEVPSTYIANISSIFEFDGIEGDDSESYLFKMEFVISDNDQVNIKQEALVLLYLDRIYLVNEHFINSSKNILEHSEPSDKESHGFYVFRDNMVNINKSYYFSFDPNSINYSDISDNDFIVRMQLENNIQIEGYSTVSKPSCLMHGVNDGIAYELTVSGTGCSVDYLRVIHTKFKEQFEIWKVGAINGNK